MAVTSRTKSQPEKPPPEKAIRTPVQTITTAARPSHICSPAPSRGRAMSASRSSVRLSSMALIAPGSFE